MMPNLSQLFFKHSRIWTHHLLVLSLFLLLSRSETKVAAQLDSTTDSIQNSTTERCSSDWTFVQFKYVIRIDPDSERAVDDQCCHPPDNGGYSDTPCKSLNYALQHFQNLDYVMFFLAAPNATYPLNISHRLTGRNGFALCGNDSLYVDQQLLPKVQCESRSGHSGLSFMNSSNIILRQVQLLYCGTIQNSTSKDMRAHDSDSIVLLTIRVALYFYNCTNVLMEEIKVLNSSRAIGVIMYDTDGVVKVNNCTFAHNQVEEDSIHYGGGGFSIEFTYCKPGDVTCNNTKYDSIYKRNKYSTYSFMNCTFKDNYAHNSPTNVVTLNTITKISSTDHDAIGLGGGLSIYFNGDALNNSVTIAGCDFIHNLAVWGGGINIAMKDYAIGNQVFLSESNFKRNHAYFENDRGTGGGGINIFTTIHNWSDDHKIKSKFHINKCDFTENRALEGGALYFSSIRGNVNSSEPLVEVMISETSFRLNLAQLGFAVVITNLPMYSDGQLPTITFDRCNFSSNSAKFVNESVHAVSIGTVYVNKVPVTFQSDNMFYNNSGSALAVTGTQVDFTSATAVFKSNIASHSGGGIALLGDTSIVVGPNTKLDFIDNHATHYGGAIYNLYIGDEDLNSNYDCFIHYSESYVEPDKWSAVFRFSGNDAAISGCSIFSTSILPCSWKTNNSTVATNASDIFQWNDNWQYENSLCENEIATEPHTFTLVGDQCLSTPIPVFPGNIIKLPLVARDDLYQDVSDVNFYSAQISSEFAEVQPGFTYIASNLISISGEPGHSVVLQLQTEGYHKTVIKLNLVIEKCPPGFIQTNEGDASLNVDKDITSTNSTIILIEPDQQEAKCVCPEINFLGHIKCYVKEFKSQIELNYWYGSIKLSSDSGHDHSLYLMGDLPLEYVHVPKSMDLQFDNEFFDLPNTTEKVDELLCGEIHRKGVLCGECMEGYAVAVNSPNFECVPCNGTVTLSGRHIGNLIAYIILTFAPITLFFLFIIFFNVNLASSAAAGFLLYAQIVSSGIYPVMYLVPNNGIKVKIQMAYNTIYGIFNLESFAFLMPQPLCLNGSFTTLHVLSLDYAIAAFPLLVILIIYMCFRLKYNCCCYIRRRRHKDVNLTIASSLNSDSMESEATSESHKKLQKCKINLIHAFMAFMLLSYSKFCLASMKTVIPSYLYDSTGNVRLYRVYFAGQLSFSDVHYLFPFGIVAVFILIFVVFLPPLLLLGPLQFIDWLTDKPKFSCLRRFWPSITIHTFLDAFEGYRPNRRFFTGLYLLFRLIMYLTYSFIGDDLVQLVVRQIMISTYSLLVALLRPYTSDLYNYVDTLLFLNLGILNALIIYANERNNFDTVFAFECVLIFMPLIYIICYVIWRKIHRKKRYKTIKRKIYQRLSNPVRESYRSSEDPEQERLLFNESMDYSSDDLDEGMFQRAAKRNRFRASPSETPRTTGDDPTIKSEDVNGASDSGFGQL